MELPRSLARWAALLSIFPRETISALGPLIERLDVLVGPLQVSAASGKGQPDGFDGIHRRGSYERLLTTEWLLADEIPDEFLRRATEGEHLFLQMATREPAGARRSVVLFDCGPNQLGTPRIVHLAALIVLANRAAAGKTSFEWGIAQSEEETLHGTVSEASVMKLLKSRSPHEVSADQMQRWRKLLEGAGQDLDFWLVGGTRLEKFEASRGVSFITVTDPLEPGERFLAVAIHTPRKTTKDIRLDLPDEKAATRLLRDPFEMAVAPVQRGKNMYAPVSNFEFAVGGTKLFATAADGGLVAFPVPNSPVAGTGKPKLFHPTGGKSVLSAIRHRRVLVLMTQRDDARLRIECVKSGSAYLPFRVGDYRLSDEATNFSQQVSAERLLPGVAVPVSEAVSEVLMLNSNNQLFRFFTDGAEQLCGCLETNVLALGAFLPPAIRSTGSRAVYVRKQRGEFRIHSLGLARSPNLSNSLQPDRGTRTIEGDGEQAFIGFGNLNIDPLHGLVALEQYRGKWMVVGESSYFFQQPSGTRVVGVIGKLHRWSGNGPALVVVEDDNRTIWLLGKDWSRTLPRAAADLTRVKVSETTPHLAYLTADGEVVVYSFGLETVLFRFFPGN